MNVKNTFIKKYKPVTPSLRERSILIRGEKRLRLKGLSLNHKYHAGRNSRGRITVRHCGGRHKRIYRIIDFKRKISKYSVLYRLNSEYDPNRKTNILRVYNNIFKVFYINNSSVKNDVYLNKFTNLDRSYFSNDHLKLKDIPLGSRIFNIQPNNLVKAAGTYATILSKTDSKARVKLPSKEILELDINKTASLGRNDNINHNLINLGKAGAKRWLGIRPTVKGNVMNAVDHPHGGNTNGGTPTPRTLWGKNAKWVKTRRK